MASSLSSSHFSVPTKSLQPHQSHLNFSRKSVTVNPVFNVLCPHTWKLNQKERGNHGLLVRSNVLFKFIYTSPLHPKRWFSSPLVLSVSSTVASNHISSENVHLVDKADKHDVKYTQIDSLVRVLHKSARSFSVAIKHRESTRSSPELAMAWVGVDVHAWHKHVAYQVAVYALLKTALEGRFLLYDEHGNDVSPVEEIISPKISMLLEFIESQLSTRDQNLTKWFKIVKLPLLSGLFIPLFKRWSAEHDRSLHTKTSSGVAVIFLAISCYIAVGKLGAARISYPAFTLSIPNVVGKLMDLSHGLAPMDKLHSLASAAGIEQEFLLHFGAKILPNKASEEVSFWIGLVQKKLSAAFQRESVISRMQDFHNKQDLERNLVTLGLFAFLGSRTRLFFSGMGIKDLDERVKDFLSYLECGSLFIYPEFSSLSLYQLFMEVLVEEIGWLDLYASVPGISYHERRRSKQHATQAEKEIILSAVFSVCFDVFSGFAHFSNSTQQSLDTNMDEFLLRSRNLLTVCLEDYWAAYCRSGELLKFTEIFVPQQIIPLGVPGTTNVSALNGVRMKCADLMTVGVQFTSQRESKSSNPDGTDTITIVESPCTSETKPARESMLKNYSNKLMSTSFDILVGTRLLFIDISVATGLLLKQIRGHMLTERERKKLKRTLADFASVIPVTILMLLPVSAVGHAAMLAGIKKYIPCLIPSSYSSERLDIVKQLDRTKKMEVKSWSNL